MSLDRISTADLNVYLGIAEKNFELYMSVIDEVAVTKEDLEDARTELQKYELIVDQIKDELQNRLDKIFN